MEEFTPLKKRPSKSALMITVTAVLLVAAGAVFYVATHQGEEGTPPMTREEKREAKEQETSSGSSSPSENTANAGTAGSVSQSEVYDVTVKSDITYGTAGGSVLKLDVYMPEGVTSPTPAVIYIHGGGFHGGSKNGVADGATMLAKHGTAAIAVDYRLSGTAIFPAPLYDVKGAVRFIKVHAAEYNIDPEAIFSLGESAGGVLASLLGVTEGSTTLEGTVGGNANYSSAIAGVINISGSYVVSIVDTMSSGIKNAIASETGCEPVPSTTCKSTYEALSAETYLSSGDSPFIILHGGRDQSVPSVQAETLNSKLKALGVPSELYIAPDLGHVAGLLDRYIKEVIDFINRNS